MKRSPIRDHGAAHFMKTELYQWGEVSFRRVKRVSIAAARGIPRKTATDFATTEYSMPKVPSSPEMTFMKRRARGAKKTIWRMEFRATRMAQYSLSPPARPVQMRTWC